MRNAYLINYVRALWTLPVNCGTTGEPEWISEAVYNITHARCHMTVTKSAEKSGNQRESGNQWQHWKSLEISCRTPRRLRLYTSDSSQLSLRRFFSPDSSASVGTTAIESKSDEELSESTVDKQPSEHSTGESTVAEESAAKTEAQDLSPPKAGSKLLLAKRVFVAAQRTR